MWPPYRDYTAELSEIWKEIHLKKELVKKNEKSIET